MEEKSVTRVALVVFIAVVSLGLWSVPQVFASSGACADDLAKYCKDVQPGQGRIIKCMEEHENDLSSGCRAKRAKMERNHPCADDAIRYCSNIQPGEGRILQCLKENESELTPQCKTRIQTQRPKRARE
ncbi:MAG TPA: cysteine rich repeat-containing protein [Nitrospirota bacterium]|nr:cysteine rich repeat-containing protein [Nitrospirota bacterium]